MSYALHSSFDFNIELLCRLFTYSMLQWNIMVRWEQRQHENLCQEADSSPLRRRTLSFACHCFIIRQHMLERGGRAHQLPITHHDRKSLDCHGLMSCLPIICVCVCGCGCLKVCSLTLCLSAYMHSCLYVCVCVLVITAHLSIIDSLGHPFSNDSKGRRVRGVTEGGSERGAEE